MAKVEKKKKKNVVVEAMGQAHIQSTFNNIIISLTNNSGQVISWSSAGKMGFRGSKKNTKDQELDESLQSAPLTQLELKYWKSLTRLHCLTTVVALQKQEESNF